jgi:DNA-binding transcriptional ArsR family regulator
MVNYALSLDSVFGSLADPTRRDILQRLRLGELNVSEVAEPYAMSLPAISKHLKILEQARLVRRRKHGKERIVALDPVAVQQAAEYFRQYEQMWHERLDRLDEYLKEG